MRLALTILIAAAVVAGIWGPALLEHWRKDAAAYEPSSSLAEDLPRETFLYVEIPNVQEMRKSWADAPLGRAYRDREFQDFVAPLLSVLAEHWERARAEAVASGVPREVISWDALHGVEIGAAVQPAPVDPPGVPEGAGFLFEARAHLAAGIARPVFDAWVDSMAGEGEITRSESGAGTASALMRRDDVEIRLTVNAERDSLSLRATHQWQGSGSLADAPSYVAARERLAQPGAQCFVYWDELMIQGALLEGAAAAESANEGAQFTDFLENLFGPDGVPVMSQSVASGWHESRAYTLVRWDVNPDAAWAPLYRYEPADRSLLERIPPDATSVLIADASTISESLDAILRMLDSLGRLKGESGMLLAEEAMIENPLIGDWLYGEMRPRLDAAVEGLGSRFLGYGLPAGVGRETIYLQELADADTVREVLTQGMLDLRDGAASKDFEIEAKRLKRTVAGETVAGPAYFSLVPDPEVASVLAIFGFQLRPTIGVTDDGWLAFSLSREPVRTALREGVPVLEDDVRSNPEFSAFLHASRDDAFFLYWADPRPGLRLLGGMLGGLAAMAEPQLRSAGAPLDFAAVPDGEFLARHAETFEITGWSEAEDLVFEATGTVGLADFVMLAGAVVNLLPVFVDVQDVLASMAGGSAGF